MDEICDVIENDIENSVPRALAQEILNKLFNQKASGQFCDVQFLHGSAILWAHSCVLASYSPFMMRLFNKYAEENESWSFNKPMQVNISSVSKCNGSSRNNCVDCTCKIIDFIYTGKIKLDPEHLDHVVNLSNNLEIDVLLLICQRYKRDHISLLRDLSISNQIHSGNSCEDIVDVKAYIDKLNHSISSGMFKMQDKYFADCSLISDVKTNSGSSNDNSDEYSMTVNDNPRKSSFIAENSRETLKIKNVSSKSKKEYICTACNFKSFNNLKFKQHKKVFHIRNYVCLECDYTSYKMGEVIEHLIKTSHGGQTCSLCLYEAESPQALQNHFNDHSKSYPFKCTMCKQRFKYRNDWVRHKYSPFHEKELFTSLENLKITPVIEEKHFSCRICKYEFLSEDLLQKHSHIFHKRKYICLSCDFNTFKIESILEHLLEAGHEENICSICLFVASDTDNLKIHLLDHKSTQPFSCTICHTRFQTRNEWWRHELAHGSQKPFKCQFCDLSFQTSPYLKTHILYRHKQKTHTCDICGYGAPFASKLEKHSLIHKNKYKCKISNCSFNCASEVLLKKHKKVHISNALPCPMCGLTFKFVKNMKRHIKLVHNTKNIMLTCPTCGYCNKRIDKMKEHCKNMHMDDINVLDTINKQYEHIKAYQVPEVIKKKKKSKKERVIIDTDMTAIENNLETNKQLDSTKESDDQFMNTESLKQTVFLSEATSELNILCENEGKPIPVASVTSTNMLTIGNFREGTGSMTLNEATGVLTLNNINLDSKGAVFLNESTGVLSYINLNIENTNETHNVSSENQQEKSEQVQLNEVTGEIVTITEENSVSTKVMNGTPEEDFPFDTFGFDVNEDSCDGFDDFDSLFLDTFSPLDSTSSNVEEILKNNTNEIFRNSEYIPRLDEMTGELTFNKNSLERQSNIPSEEEIWPSVNRFTENSIMQDVSSGAYECLLNEVTGEFS